MPDDEDAKNNKLTNGKDAMTLNERRALLDLPPVKGGDVLVDQNGNEIDTTKKAVVTIKVKTKGVSIKDNEVTTEDKEAFRLAIQDKQTTYERRYKKVLKEFIDNQLERVLDDLGAKKTLKSMIDGNLNPADEAAKMSDLTIGVFYDLLQEQGDLAIKFAGDTERFILTDAAKQYVRASIDQAHLSYSEDIVKTIGAAVSEGLQEGESLPQIGKRVTKAYEGVKGYKMARIVRTETLKASNQGTLYGYQQLGITRKEWFTNPGACEYCIEVKKMGVKGLNENYLAKGESLTANGNTQVYDYEDVAHPPLHPSCRCCLLPVKDN